MKIKIIFCSVVLLLFVSTSISFGATENVNTFFGNGAGVSTNPATELKDTFIGCGAGYTNSTGTYNTFVGAGAGYFGNGSWNTFIGAGAGVNNTASYNTFMGAGAGNANTTAAYNTFIGYGAGGINVLGVGNTFMGAGAGSTTNGSGIPDASDSGSANTFMGAGAGQVNTTGAGNMIIGFNSGYSNITGYKNTFMGTYAGYLNTAGAANVFIGFMAGYNETGSNKLYIDNSNTTTPLIYGDFSSRIVQINGKLVSASDDRLKKNIEPLKSSLNKLMTLKGVSYEWKSAESRGKGRDIGLIAQDVEKVLPELVFTDDKGIKSISYDKMVPVLVEAIKEQQTVIKLLTEKLAKLDKLEAEVTMLKNSKMTTQNNNGEMLTRK